MNSEISKAVILARGLGTRMRRADPAAALTTEQAGIAERGVKGMIPVGRPFMDYSLSALADAGFTDACLVTGPEHESVRVYYDGLETSRIRISHAIQAEPRGTADAVLAAEGFAGKDEFLVINSDNYYPAGALREARQMEGPGLIAFSSRAMIEEGGVPEERVGTFPRVRVSDNGVLSRLIPSSEAGANAYVSMNCWRFGPPIFEACRSVALSSRGELELPDAVDFSMRRLGQRYRVFRSEEPVLDLSSRADIARVAHQLSMVRVSL